MGVPRKHHKKVSVRGQQSALSHTQKANRSRTFIAFRHNVPPGSQKFNNIDETLESDTQSALAENNFYKTSDLLLQKGKIP